MKKVLAFVLVLAMVLGSVSMAFAATYKDQADITNTEAVGVLSMLKILEGDANGFRPKDTLTRAEAAAIVARLALGREDADKLTATGTSFSDVPSTHWAAGYIAYCVAEGIIAGNGDGTFDPDGVLTVSAFTKMMLCTLGYEAPREGLVGANWEANTAALAVKAGISVKATGACTRETAAQLGLNTLEATTVEYAQAAVTVNTGSTEVVVGGSNAQPVTDTVPYNYAGAEASPKLQLVEKVYGYSVTKNKNSQDDFGNPAVEWSYKTETVKAADEAIATFTKLMTSEANRKAILNAIKNYTVNGTKVATIDTIATTNGALGDVTFTSPASIVSTVALATANAKLVQVFANKDKEITKIVATTYDWSKIASVTTNSKGDVTYTGSNGLSGVDYADEATDDTIKINGTVAKNDYVTFVKKGSVTYVYPSTKVTGTQTAKDGTTITVDGTTYTAASGLTSSVTPGAFANSKNEANYYLDQYGFVFAASDVDADLEYAVVDRIALKTSTGVSDAKTIEAVLIFKDGTKQTVKVSKYEGVKAADVTNASLGAMYTDTTNAALRGRFFTYDVTSEGNYEIKASAQNAAIPPVASGAGLITKGVAKITGVAVSANADTLYIVKTLKSGTTDEIISVYTGYANVPSIKASANGAVSGYYVTDKNNANKILAVYIDGTDAATGDSTTKNIFYATQNYADRAENGTGSDKFYTIKGYLNGESKAVQFKSATSESAVAKGSFYKLTIADDGYTTAFDDPGFTATGTATQADVDSVALGTLKGYTINDETVAYVIDTDNVMTESNASVIVSGSAFYFNVVKADGTAVEKNTIKTIYIKQPN